MLIAFLLVVYVLLMIVAWGFVGGAYRDDPIPGVVVFLLGLYWPIIPVGLAVFWIYDRASEFGERWS